MDDFIGLAIRVSITYLFLRTIMWLSGMRTPGSLSPLDFVIALIVGDLFDDVFWAEVSVAQGFVAFTTLISLHIVTSYAIYRSPFLAGWLDSRRSLMIRDGKFVEAGLRRERIPEQDVLSHLRQNGVERLEDVHEASWEPGGALSVIKREAAKTLQKRELPLLKAIWR